MSFAAPAAEPRITGTWITSSGSQITISACGKGYCGHISKVVVPPHLRKAASTGAPFTDALNKKPSLRNRPIMGLRILTLDRQGAQGKFKGKIYNPEDGGTYSGTVEMLGATKLRLTGCAMAVLCRGETWTLARR